jgi:hypothetical protein
VEFASVFCLSLVLDMVWVLWIVAVSDNRAVMAGAVSGLIQTLSMLSCLLVVENHALLVANVAGHTVGGFVGVIISKVQNDRRL